MNCKQNYKKYLLVSALISVFLLGGTGSTIFSKTGYQLQAEGRDGDVHYFIKPLFFNWAMFLGMAFCLIVYLFQYIILPCFKKEDVFDETQQKTGNKSVMTWKGYLLMLIPSIKKS